jgi:hypothetical protein
MDYAPAWTAWTAWAVWAAEGFGARLFVLDLAEVHALESPFALRRTRRPVAGECSPGNRSTFSTENEFSVGGAAATVMQSEEFGYEVNAMDEVQSVSRTWLEFAAKNGWSESSPEQIVGRSLWNFISGRQTQHLYAMLFRKVRARQEKVSFSLRCDSPDCRRFMSLEISPLEEGCLKLRGILLRSEARPVVKLLDSVIDRTEEFVTICSWCQRVCLPAGEWVEVEVAVDRLKLFESVALPELTHGICPPCEIEIDSC